MACEYTNTASPVNTFYMGSSPAGVLIECSSCLVLETNKRTSGVLGSEPAWDTGFGDEEILLSKTVFVYLMTELALRFGEVLCWSGVMQWKCIMPLERAVKRGREEGWFINMGYEVSRVEGKLSYIQVVVRGRQNLEVSTVCLKIREIKWRKSM